jgi:hypothetical protein
MDDLTGRLQAPFRSYAAAIDLHPDRTSVDRLCEQFRQDLGRLIAEYGHAARGRRHRRDTERGLAVSRPALTAPRAGLFRWQARLPRERAGRDEKMLAAEPKDDLKKEDRMPST